MVAKECPALHSRACGVNPDPSSLNVQLNLEQEWYDDSGVSGDPVSSIPGFHCHRGLGIACGRNLPDSVS